MAGRQPHASQPQFDTVRRYRSRLDVSLQPLQRVNSVRVISVHVVSVHTVGVAMPGSRDHPCWSFASCTQVKPSAVKWTSLWHHLALIPRTRGRVGCGVEERRYHPIHGGSQMRHRESAVVSKNGVIQIVRHAPVHLHEGDTAPTDPPVEPSTTSIHQNQNVHVSLDLYDVLYLPPTICVPQSYACTTRTLHQNGTILQFCKNNKAVVL